LHEADDNKKSIKENMENLALDSAAYDFRGKRKDNACTKKNSYSLSLYPGKISQL
jgi:hypothetical protein